MTTEAGSSSKPTPSTSKGTKPPKGDGLAQRAKGDGQRKSTKKAPPPATAVTQAKGSEKAVLERKTAFRHVLDNPLHIDWPAVPLNVENAILSCVVQLLEPVRPYHEQREAEARKRKNAKRGPFIPKKKQKRNKDVVSKDAETSNGVTKGSDSKEAGPSKLKRKRADEAEDEENEDSDEDEDENEQVPIPPPKRRKTSEDEGEKVPDPDAIVDDPPGPGVDQTNGPPNPQPAPLPRPEILDHIVFGLNEVTKRLEAQSLALRSVQKSPSEIVPPQPVTEASDDMDTTHPPPPSKLLPPTKHSTRLVLICRTDADSPTMIAHFPTLIAACNSVPHEAPDVVLVALPRSAESTLAEAAGLRRALVVAFDAGTPGLETLISQFLPSIPILRASWLAVQPTTSTTTSKTTAPSAAVSLQPTHIKHLKTSVPKDIKAAKKKRTDERSAAKKAKIKTLPKVVISGKKKPADPVVEGSVGE